MAYRDELAAAYEKIAALERQIAPRAADHVGTPLRILVVVTLVASMPAVAFCVWCLVS